MEPASSLLFSAYTINQQTHISNYVQSHIISHRQHASVTTVTIIMALLATFILYSCIHELIYPSGC